MNESEADETKNEASVIDPQQNESERSGGVWVKITDFPHGENHASLSTLTLRIFFNIAHSRKCKSKYWLY